METINAPKSLKEIWADFKVQNPKVRIRDAAKELGTSEAELLATGLGESVTLLEGNFEELLKEIPKLGHVMALTRNDHVVHERKGTYEKVSFKNHVGLALGDDIDLRLFMNAWHFAFAVNENDRFSIQFFSKHGDAIHKIYLTESSDQSAYTELVAKYKATEQPAAIAAEPTPSVTEKEVTEKEAVDIPAFQAEWLNLKDTHEFFGLIRKYKLPRQEALRHAPEGHAYQFAPLDLRKVFEAAAEAELPIMVFVGNQGCIQIHTGTVKKLVVMGPWFNVLDPEFNLHLREDAIDEAWVVIKPTEDGIVTGLELYSKNGEQIAQIFGKRKPGIPELEAWQQIVKTNALPLN
jgi:putative hemin transport protein